MPTPELDGDINFVVCTFQEINQDVMKNLCAFLFATSCLAAAGQSNCADLVAVADQLDCLQAFENDAFAQAAEGAGLQPISFNEPYLFWEVVANHTEGELSGMVTSRLYVGLSNPDDRVVSCSGDDENVLIINSTSEPAWWNDPQYDFAVPRSTVNGVAVGINPGQFESNPNLQFDSWVTIGSEDISGATVPALLSSPDNTVFDSFRANEGYSINTIADEVGIGWFALPLSGNIEDVAGEDLKVLIAQFTTPGQISGQLQIQIFLNGNNQNEFREVLTIPHSPLPPMCADEDNNGVCDEIPGCIHASAVNYDPFATIDDDSC